MTPGVSLGPPLGVVPALRGNASAFIADAGSYGFDDTTLRTQNVIAKVPYVMTAQIERRYEIRGDTRTLSFWLLVLTLALPQPLLGSQPGPQQQPEVIKVADVPYPLSVSTDGRLVAELGSLGNLAVRELETGATRNVTTSAFPELVMNAVFSPTDERIAFAWHNDDDHDDVRMVRSDGSGLKVLHRDPAVRSAWVKAWTPDGAAILVTLLKHDSTGQLALIRGEGGPPRVLASVNTERQALPELMAFSPDGHLIAYDAVVASDEADHDIFLLDEGNGPARPVVEDPADDRLLGWAPSGDGIVFASDRSGTVDVWLQPLSSNGEPATPPRLLLRDIGPLTPLGIARDGTYYIGVTRCECHVYIGELDPETGALVEAPRVLDSALHNSGAYWSPDGQRLAYARPVGGVVPSNMGVMRGSWRLVIRSFAADVEQTMPVGIDVLHQLRPMWSADGRTVLLKGWDHLAYPREIVVGIDVETRNAATLLSSVSVWQRQLDWLTWSADGTALYYTDLVAATRTGIFRWDLESERESALLLDEPPPYYYGLTSSPDGEYLAYGLWDNSRRTSSLAVLHLQTGETTLLVEVESPPSGIAPPAWFSDSRNLLYEADGELWRVGRAGGEPERLGAFPSPLYNQAGVSIHPDGLRIAFVGEEDRSSEVWAIRHLVPER